MSTSECLAVIGSRRTLGVELARLRWLLIPLGASLLLSGCNKFERKKPDATKGVVAGIVFCADTGKPARFATVVLTAAPKEGDKSEQGDPLPAAEITVTDLEGRFRMEAVQPGRYYAFATQDGYLDPALALDPDKLKSLPSDKDRHFYSIKTWKDNLVDVTVSVRRVAEISLEIQRAAAISGAVSFDDGSPAIGMRFQLFRKTDKGAWTGVGLALMDTWTLQATSDSHGVYTLPNLMAGEYTVCTLMPTDTEQAASRVCLGNVFRRKDAKTVKVATGETVGGVDIVIPLTGLHGVSGLVTALADGRALGHGTVRLLYADDREPARETDLGDDGSFSFDYVPEGKYILAVTGAQDAEEKVEGAEPTGTVVAGTASPGTQVAAPDAAATKPAAHVYADKEMPVNVMNDMENLSVPLPYAVPATIPVPAGPPAG